MAGAGRTDSVAWRLDLPESTVSGIEGVRIGVWFDDENAPVDAETREALEGLAEDLRHAGARVIPFEPPVNARELIALYDCLFHAELTRNLGRDEWLAAVEVERDLPEDARRSTRAFWQVLNDQERQLRISAAWNAGLGDLDVVVAPAVHSPAPKHSAVPVSERTISHHGLDRPVLEMLGAWSKLVNVLRAPSTIVPAGLGSSTGLPIGAQFIGRRFADYTTIGLAELLEREQVLTFRRPPM